MFDFTVDDPAMSGTKGDLGNYATSETGGSIDKSEVIESAGMSPVVSREAPAERRASPPLESIKGLPDNRFCQNSVLQSKLSTKVLPIAPQAPVNGTPRFWWRMIVDISRLNISKFFGAIFGAIWSRKFRIGVLR